MNAFVTPTVELCIDFMRSIIHRYTIGLHASLRAFVFTSTRNKYP